jgi:hypothetical protein
MANWGSESFFNTPVRNLDSVPKGSIADVKFLCPFGKAESFVFISNVYIATAISALLFIGCPFTVFRRIMTIVINTFQGKSFVVSRRHVSDKINDVKPSFANFYTSVTVTVVSMVRWIIASSNHICIDAEEWVSPFAMLCNCFFKSATAAYHCASRKVVNAYVFRRTTAITLAKGVVFVCVRFFACFKNSKFVEFLSWFKGRQFPINKCIHDLP